MNWLPHWNAAPLERFGVACAAIMMSIIGVDTGMQVTTSDRDMAPRSSAARPVTPPEAHLPPRR